MKKPKKIPPVPAGQTNLVNDALTNETFRNLLLNPKTNRDQISQELDRLNIFFKPGDKDKALDIFEKIDWGKFKALEDLLGRETLKPRMN